MWCKLSVHFLSENSAGVEDTRDLFSFKSVLSLEICLFLLFVRQTANFFKGLKFLWHGPCQTKIAYLYTALVGQKDVTWFEISMNHVGRMKVVYSTKQIVEDYFCMFHIK